MHVHVSLFSVLTRFQDLCRAGTALVEFEEPR